MPRADATLRSTSPPVADQSSLREIPPLKEFLEISIIPSAVSPPQADKCASARDPCIPFFYVFLDSNGNDHLSSVLIFSLPILSPIRHFPQEARPAGLLFLHNPATSPLAVPFSAIPPFTPFRVIMSMTSLSFQ